MSGRPYSPAEVDERRRRVAEFVEKRMNDREIARLLGVHSETVRMDRRALGLDSPWLAVTPEIQARREIVRQMVEQGASDRQIGTALGASPHIIRRDRRVMNLPPGIYKNVRYVLADECSIQGCRNVPHKRRGELCGKHYRLELRQRAEAPNDVPRFTRAELEEASCVDSANPEAWTADGDDPECVWETARRVCESCPIQERCLDIAIAYDEWGVWGGTTRAERLAMVRRRYALRRAAS